MNMLEAIKQKRDSLDQLVENEMVNVNLLNDFNYLIEQAEKVKEQQNEIDRLQKVIERLQEFHFVELQREKATVERYEKAMYQAIDEIVKVEFVNAVDILEKALKY